METLSLQKVHGGVKQRRKYPTTNYIGEDIAFINVRTSSTDMFKKGCTISWLNFLAFLLHTALVVLCIVDWDKSVYMVKYERFWKATNTSALPDYLRSDMCPPEPTTCAGISPTPEKYTDFFEWTTCLRTYLDCEGVPFDTDQRLYDPTNIRLYEMDPAVVYELKMVWYLLIFSIITAAVHLLLHISSTSQLKAKYPEQFNNTILSTVSTVTLLGGTFDNVYKRFSYLKPLYKGINWYRWGEYSITSSIMLLVLCALNRVTEIYLTYSISILSTFTNLSALVYEVVLYLETKTDEKEVLYVAKYLRWASLIWSYGSFVLTIIMLWDAFNASINPYLQIEGSGALFGQLFDFIRILNIAILFLYGVFPIIHMFANGFYLGAWKNSQNAYVNGEIAYIIASFAAKGTLVITLFYSSQMRSD